MDTNPLAHSPELAALHKRIADLEAREARLQSAYTHLKQLYEQFPYGYQSLDGNGCLIEVNQAWLETLGYTREEVIGRNFGEFLHPDEKDHFKEYFPRFKAIGEILGAECELIKKNGSTLLVAIDGKIGKDRHGRFQQTHCIIQNITERRRTEEALRLRESYLSAIIENQAGLLWLKDLDGRFLSVNTAFAISCGLENPESLVGKTDFDIWPRDLADQYVADDVRVIRSRKPCVVEEPIAVQEKIRWFETYKTPIIDKLGTVLGTTGYSLDITERKQNEQKLRESEERLKLALFGADLGIWDWHVPSGAITFDERWTGMLGYSVDEIEPHISAWEMLLHPDDKSAVIRALNDHLEGRSANYEVECRLRHKSGQWVWVLDKGRIIERDSQGKALRGCGTHLDITERKRAAETLWESREILRAVLNAIPMRVFWKDKNLIYLGCNTSFAQDAGFEKPEDIIGKDDYAAGWNEQAELYRADDKAVIETGKARLLFEEPQTSPAGKQSHLLTSKLPLRDANGAIVGVLGTYYDITAFKQAEAEKKSLQVQLIQAQKMEAIGTLAGGIAHDFNNILGAIIGYAEMALDISPPESAVAKDLNKVLEAGFRASALVKQILAFSRQANTEPVSLRPACIVKEIIKLLRPSLPSTITIKQRIDTTTASILADPTQIHQILMNLCTNAFHAMEQTGGTLEIAITECELSRQDLQHQPKVQPGRFVVLSIGDSGPGIAPGIQDKIFDPYFTTKQIGKGTGMGLAIVHGIVTTSGGFITAANAPGGGALFQVYFPITKQEKTTADATAETIALGREHILLIDDEEILVELGRTMLERLGYEVTVRTSSLEALATFQNQPERFDAVITDQTMPGMTGSDLARRMLQIRPDLPIILCTGYSSLISEEKARSMGIKGFAMNPLTMHGIAKLLRKSLEPEKRSA